MLQVAAKIAECVIGTNNAKMLDTLSWIDKASFTGPQNRC